jgi:hypothetical protein
VVLGSIGEMKDADELPDYAPAPRFVFLLTMALTDFGCEKAISLADWFPKRIDE